jgi:hypothetical protein
VSHPHQGAAAADDFLRRWHAFARAWRKADPGARETLVRDALADGLPPVREGSSEPSPPEEQVLVRCAKAVLRASGAFDAEGYAAARPNRVVLRTSDPLTQFVTAGWRELRAPSLDFDLWWYWTEYLDPTREDVNPLLHYLLAGRQVGHLPVPPPAPEREHPRLVDGPVRRICLFAAYDRDGLVDQYVVDYLRELGRHADVFYLADGVLEPGELEKLDGVVRGAWSIPHGRYDFGSYSMLARDLVGWDKVASYDELVLANDSCFLLRPLDDTFAEMDTRACDWWGLQATSMEFNEDDVRDPEALMPLAEAKATMVGPRRWSDVLYLHLSSYFLAFRGPVLEDPGFRRRLDAVCRQADKMSVVHKYEVGISRYLMDSGFEFDTLVTDLYPFHPLYSRRFFELAAQGFPVVKRNFLAENPRRVADFGQWGDWLREAVPEAPMAAILASIDRVSPQDLRVLSTLVHFDERGHKVTPGRPLVGYGFRSMSREAPKFDHWWAFPVDRQTHQLPTGSRAVLEAVRDDPSIRKIVLTRSRGIELDGENLVVLPLGSRDGSEELARCGQVLLDGHPDLQLEVPMPAGWHRFVHVGGGLPIGPPRLTPDELEGEARLAARAVASHAEALARAASSPRPGLDHLWVTGLPRHDLVVRASLPGDLAREEADLRARLGGRRLLVFWPRPGAKPPGLDTAELGRLADWATAHHAVIGVRETVVDSPHSWTYALRPVVGVGVAARAVAHGSTVLRVADAVVTDDADEAVDFLLTGRRLLHWLRAQPVGSDAGVACYPPDHYLPGPVSRTFDQLLAALDTAFDPVDAELQQQYERALRLAFAHTDDRNGWRLAWRMRGHP